MRKEIKEILEGMEKYGTDYNSFALAYFCVYHKEYFCIHHKNKGIIVNMDKEGNKHYYYSDVPKTIGAIHCIHITTIEGLWRLSATLYMLLEHDETSKEQEALAHADKMREEQNDIMDGYTIE